MADQIMRRRSVLYPAYKKAKSLRKKANLVGDRLYIDGSLFTVDNVHTVPFNLADLNEKQNQKFAGFFGRFSCLSNFYPSTFTSEGKEYLSNEQYYQAQKSTEANDFDTLVSIGFYVMTNFFFVVMTLFCIMTYFDVMTCF